MGRVPVAAVDAALRAAGPRARAIAYSAAAAGLVVFAIVELVGACYSSLVLQLAALAVLVSWGTMESRVQQCLRIGKGADGALPALVALAVALLCSAGVALSDENGGHVFDTPTRLGLKAANARFLLCAGLVPMFCQVVLMGWVAYRPGVHPAWAASAAVVYAGAWLVVVLWARRVPDDVIGAAVGAAVVGLGVACADIARCSAMARLLGAYLNQPMLVSLRDTRRLALASPHSKGTRSGHTAVTMRDVMGSGVASFGEAERGAALVTPLNKSSVTAAERSNGRSTPPGQASLRPNRLPDRKRVARRCSSSNEESKQRPDLDLAAALSAGGVTNAVIAAASPSVSTTTSRRDSGNGSVLGSPDILRSTSSLMRSTRNTKLVNAGEDVLMHRCVDILMAVKKKVPRTTARQIKYVLRLLRANRESQTLNVRKHLSTATEDGSIDKTTMNWVESTLQLNRSAQLAPLPASTPGRPQLTKHLSTRSSNSDMVSALGDQVVVRQLGQVLTWDFDVFELVAHCKRRYLSLVAAEIFQQLTLFPSFDVDGDTFLLVMDKLEFTYCYVPDSPNDYHNALHATDVLQAVAVFSQEVRIGSCLEPLEVVALLFAAIVHDYRHPGVSNNFLMHTSSTLALRYNDDSVLENFHSASAFEVVATPKYNIFKRLTKAQFSTLRKTVIQCILATDLAKGTANIAKFTRKVLIPAQAVEEPMSSGDTDDEDGQQTIPALGEDAAVVLMQMVLKCADVSHPTRPMEQHVKWSNMITREFYAQGDLERSLHMDVSPLCDRHNHNLNKSQAGFINFIVRPAFTRFCEYLGNNKYLDILEDNFCKWRDNVVESKPDDFALPTNPKAHCSARLVLPIGSPVLDRDASRRASMPTLQLNPRDTLLTRFAGVSTRHVANGGHGIAGAGYGLPPHHVPPVHPGNGSGPPLRLTHPAHLPVGGVHRHSYTPGLPSLDSNGSLKSSPASHLLGSPNGSIDSVGSGRLVPNAMGSFGGGPATIGGHPLSARPGYGRMPSTVAEAQPGDLEQGEDAVVAIGADARSAGDGAGSHTTPVALAAGSSQHMLKVLNVSSRDDISASGHSVYQTPRDTGPLAASVDISVGNGASPSASGEFDLTTTRTTILNTGATEAELAMLRDAAANEQLDAAPNGGSGAPKQ